MSVAYHVYAMGRMEKIWGKDWAEFRPERWLEREVAADKWRFVAKDVFSYPVFQAGPRVCLGKEIAFDLQMKRVVVGVLKRFQVVPEKRENEEEPKFVAHLFAKMKAFEPQVVNQILTIPLSRRFGQDRVAWKLNARGLFSVKSAYTIARELLLGNVFASTSDGDPYGNIWRARWRAKDPSKVVIFGWRLVHNLLPTRTALTAKGYEGPLSCVCNEGVGTLEHLFRDCRIAKEIFSVSPFSFPAFSSTQKDWLLL
ncbi:hypothetical protein ACLB2K_010708 [Fragaria x ananassa]